jgi:hypothetical protein
MYTHANTQHAESARSPLKKFRQICFCVFLFRFGYLIVALKNDAMGLYLKTRVGV